MKPNSQINMASSYSHMGKQIARNLKRGEVDKPVVIKTVDKQQKVPPYSYLSHKTHRASVNVITTLQHAIMESKIIDDPHWVSSLSDDSLYLLYLVKNDSRVRAYFGAMINRMYDLDGALINNIQNDVQLFMTHSRFSYSDLSKVPLIGAEATWTNGGSPEMVYTQFGKDYKDRIQQIFSGLVTESITDVGLNATKFLNSVTSFLSSDGVPITHDNLLVAKGIMIGTFFYSSYTGLSANFEKAQTVAGKFLDVNQNKAIIEDTSMNGKETNINIKHFIKSHHKFNKLLYYSEELIKNGLFYTRGTRKVLEPLSPLTIGTVYTSFVVDLYLWTQHVEHDKDVNLYTSTGTKDRNATDILLVRYLCYFAPHAIKYYTDDNLANYHQIMKHVTFWLYNTMSSNNVDNKIWNSTNGDQRTFIENDEKHMTQPWIDWRMQVRETLCRIAQIEVETIYYPQIYDKSVTNNGIFTPLFRDLWDDVTNDRTLSMLNKNKVLKMEKSFLAPDLASTISSDGITGVNDFKRAYVKDNLPISNVPITMGTNMSVNSAVYTQYPIGNQGPTNIKLKTGILMLNPCIGLFISPGIISQTINSLSNVEPLIFGKHLQEKIKQYRQTTGNISVLNRKMLTSSLGIAYQEPKELGKHEEIITLMALATEWMSFRL